MDGRHIGILLLILTMYSHRHVILHLLSGGEKRGCEGGHLRGWGICPGRHCAGCGIWRGRNIKFWNLAASCELAFALTDQLINVSSIALRNYTPNLAYCSQSTLMPSLWP